MNLSLEARNPRSFTERGRSPVRLVGALLWIFLLGLQLAYAQGATATLSGTIMDSSGAAVPDAILTVINESTRLQRETTSGSEGYFTIPLLPPGRYTVTAKRQGFNQTEIKDLVL